MAPGKRQDNDVACCEFWEWPRRGSNGLNWSSPQSCESRWATTPAPASQIVIQRHRHVEECEPVATRRGAAEFLPDLTLIAPAAAIVMMSAETIRRAKRIATVCLKNLSNAQYSDDG